MVLVDSSVWIDIFARPARLAIEDVGSLEEVVTCLPVIQEVLQGFQGERAYAIARDAMHSLPVVESPMASVVYEEAIALFRAARRQGLTPRSGVDCLIAACALRNGLTVAHRDRDYELIAKVSPLSTRRLKPRMHR